MSVDKRFLSPDKISICVRSRLSWGVRAEEIEIGFSGLTLESDSSQRALHYFLKLDKTTSPYKLSWRITRSVYAHTVHMCDIWTQPPDLVRPPRLSSLLSFLFTNLYVFLSPSFNFQEPAAIF